MNAMNPELILELLKDQEDILTPESGRVQKTFDALSCPECGDSVRPKLDSKKPYSVNALLPNYLGECVSCHCVFNPNTGQVINSGTTTDKY